MFDASDEQSTKCRPHEHGTRLPGYVVAMELLLLAIGTPAVLLGSMLGLDWLEQGLRSNSSKGSHRIRATRQPNQPTTVDHRG